MYMAKNWEQLRHIMKDIINFLNDKIYRRLKKIFSVYIEFLRKHFHES